MKTWVCANCKETATSVVKDKVWNKPVCHSCKQQALNLNVRFGFDFESLNDTLSNYSTMIKQAEIQREAEKIWAMIKENEA